MGLHINDPAFYLHYYCPHILTSVHKILQCWPMVPLLSYRFHKLDVPNDKPVVCVSWRWLCIVQTASLCLGFIFPFQTFGHSRFRHILIRLMHVVLHCVNPFWTGGTQKWVHSCHPSSFGPRYHALLSNRIFQRLFPTECRAVNLFVLGKSPDTARRMTQWYDRHPCYDGYGSRIFWSQQFRGYYNDNAFWIVKKGYTDVRLIRL